MLHGLDRCTVRLSNPFGVYRRMRNHEGAVKGSRSARSIGSRSRSGGDGLATRDDLHVGNGAEALPKVVGYRGPYRMFNIDSGTGMDLNQIIGRIETVLGHAMTRVDKPGRRFDVPTEALRIGLAWCEPGRGPRTRFGDGRARTAAWITRTDVQRA